MAHLPAYRKMQKTSQNSEEKKWNLTKGGFSPFHQMNNQHQTHCAKISGRHVTLWTINRWKNSKKTLTNLKLVVKRRWMNFQKGWNLTLLLVFPLQLQLLRLCSFWYNLSNNPVYWVFPLFFLIITALRAARFFVVQAI